jgi:ribosomal protein S18 acetylase RimI-like enzyme
MPQTIRRATLADAPIVVEFNRLLALESEGKTLDVPVLEKGVAAALSDPSKAATYYLAEENGEVLGQLCITTEWSDWRNGWQWWIQSVYVRPEARRRGVFRSLYEYIYREAYADPEVIGIWLYVDRDNHAGQQTYLSLGMEWTKYLVLERFPLERRGD